MYTTEEVFYRTVKHATTTKKQTNVKSPGTAVTATIMGIVEDGTNEAIATTIIERRLAGKVALPKMVGDAEHKQSGVVIATDLARIVHHMGDTRADVWAIYPHHEADAVKGTVEKTIGIAADTVETNTTPTVVNAAANSPVDPPVTEPTASDDTDNAPPVKPIGRRGR